MRSCKVLFDDSTDVVSQTFTITKTHLSLQLHDLRKACPYICDIKQKRKKVMKAKSILFIALMTLSASVMASVSGSEDSRVVIVSQKSGLFKVIYEGAGKVTMKIADSNGAVVFTETIKSANGFIRPVNFAGMEPGTYTITLIDEKGAVVNNISYENKSAVKNVHVAKISGEKYLLAVANGATEQINVRIFDGNNNLVHNEDVTISGSLGLVYNLKAVEGTPTFQVTDKTGNDLMAK